MKKTVLSLEQALTLPYATQRFVHLGWRIIRVESPPDEGSGRGGDPNRYIGEDTGSDDLRTYFIAPNIGKEAITLNLRKNAGQELLKNIIRELKVDVFLCNTLPKRYSWANSVISGIGLGLPIYILPSRLSELYHILIVFGAIAIATISGRYLTYINLFIVLIVSLPGNIQDVTNSEHVLDYLAAFVISIIAEVAHSGIGWSFVEECGHRPYCRREPVICELYQTTDPHRMDITRFARVHQWPQPQPPEPEPKPPASMPGGT